MKECSKEAVIAEKIQDNFMDNFTKNFFQPCFLYPLLFSSTPDNTLKHQTLFHQCPKRSKEQQPTQQPTAVKPSEWQLSASSNHLHLSSFTMAKILKIVVTPESSKRSDLISREQSKEYLRYPRIKNI